MVEMWYYEINFYNYNKPGFSGATGHFTQLIWKSTTSLGCGIATNAQNRIFGSCNYFGQGNILNAGFFQNNVLPLA